MPLTTTQVSAIQQAWLNGSDINTITSQVTGMPAHMGGQTNLAEVTSYIQSWGSGSIPQGTTLTGTSSVNNLSGTATAPAPTTTQSGTSGGTSTTATPTFSGLTTQQQLQVGQMLATGLQPKQNATTVAQTLFGGTVSPAQVAAVQSFMDANTAGQAAGLQQTTPTGGGTPTSPGPTVIGSSPATTVETSGSVNPFSPGTETTTTTNLQTAKGGQIANFETAAAEGGGQFTTDQQLALQQAELNRQQLEGALNERGIAESGRADLLRDIQGLQSELSIPAAPSNRGAGPFGRERLPQEVPQQPTVSPDGRPTGQPENAFKPFDAPDISSLNEPDAFSDLREGLRAAQASESAKLGQSGSLNDIGAAAEAAAMRQLSTVVPGGFGNFGLDPFTAIQRTKNGVGNNGRNLASPQEIMDAEIDARRKSRELDQMELSKSILQSWRRATSIQAQQDELLKQFQELNHATGFDVSRGTQTLDPRVQAQLRALRGELEQLEQAKVSAAERTQDEWKRWQAKDQQRLALIRAGAGHVKTKMSRQHRRSVHALQAHHEGVARKLAISQGMNPDERMPSGLTRTQTLMVGATAKEIEAQLRRDANRENA